MAFIYNLFDTWNNAGTVFSGIKLNITNTASAAGSKLIDLQIGGSTFFNVDKSGQVALLAGSAAAPTLIPTGDTNTGIWFPAADTIAASTGGTERFRILSSGNVGIGTTAPTTLLSVNGVASFGAGTAALPSVAAFGDLDTGMWFPAANTVAWSTGGTERIRITSAGRVGIGTSNPGELLDISEGNFRVLKTSGIPLFILRSQQAAGFNPAFAQFTRVGAGSTATPDNSTIATIQFDGLDASNAYAAFASIQAGMGVNAAGGAPGYFAFYTSPSGGGLAERFRIDSSGNVGINTAGPTTSLSVNGIASFGAGAAATPSIAAFGDLDTGMWFPAVNTIAWSTGGSERMRITSGGNLGLGTSTFGTSAATVFSIATGTAPTTGPADTIQIYSTDLSAGNTMLSLYTEGTVVNTNIVAATTHRIAIRVNGTVYYLLANTAA